MKFCEECGAQLEDDAIFCEECGASVEDIESLQPAEAVPEIEAEAVPEIEAEAVPEIEAEAVPEIEAEAVPEIEAEAVPEIEAEAVPEIEAEAVPEIDGSENSSQIEKESKEKKNKKFLIIIIITVVAVLLLVGIVAVLASGAGKNSKVDSKETTEKTVAIGSTTTDNVADEEANVDKETETEEETTIEEETTTKEETTTEEETITEETLTEEEATTTEEKDEELINVFSDNLSEGINGWIYEVHFTDEIMMTLMDYPDNRNISVYITKDEEFQSLYFGLLDEELYFNTEYIFTDEGVDKNGDSYTFEFRMIAYENGMDASLILYYDDSTVELCNGFYGLDDIYCYTEIMKNNDVLKCEPMGTVADNNSNCFYKKIKDGEVYAISYESNRDESLGLYCSLRSVVINDYEQIIELNDYKGNALYFVTNELFYYNQETVLRAEPSGSDNYYYEIRVTFTEEYIDVYWVLNDNGSETVIFDGIIDDEKMNKEVEIKNY